MKKYRQILGLSQAALAERINCSTTLIGNIEIQKRFPSSKNLDRIAEALGVTPADLFAEGETPAAVSRFAARQQWKSRLEQAVLQAIDQAFRDIVF
jgi:transcriptional regulator with XRE-family HTH domain